MARRNARDPRGWGPLFFSSYINYYLLQDIEMVPIREFTEVKLDSAFQMVEADEILGNVFSLLSCLLSVLFVYNCSCLHHELTCLLSLLSTS